MTPHTCPDCGKVFKNIQGYTGHRTIVHGDHSATHTRVKNHIMKCFRLRGFSDECATDLYNLMENEVERLQSLPSDELKKELESAKAALGSIPEQPINTAQQGTGQPTEGEGVPPWAVLGGALLLYWLWPKQPRRG